MDNASIAEGWGRWLDEHAARLLLFARQQCRLSADAEDLLQEALVETWGRTGGDRIPPLPLVYATIRRRAIDRARSDDRRHSREASTAPDRDAWFDVHPADAEFSAHLEALVKTLPAIQAEVIVLKMWGGLTFAEIAEALHVSQNTAASRYRYGIEALRAQFKEVAP